MGQMCCAHPLNRTGINIRPHTWLKYRVRWPSGAGIRDLIPLSAAKVGSYLTYFQSKVVNLTYFQSK